MTLTVHISGQKLRFPRKVKGHFMTLIKVGRTRFETVL